MAFEFDPSKEEGTSYDLLPKGVYVAEVIDASIAPTKNGNGAMLHLSWAITEGEYEKRYVWQSILFSHTSAEATRIGRARIKDICVACGIEQTITDTEVFKFKPCLISVGIEQDKNEEYPPKNKITRVLPRTVKPGPAPGAAAKDFPFNDKIPFAPEWR
jgi:hypothetical protein